MTERDLTRLRHTPVPPPDGEAKRAALAAAAAAFEKSAAEPQGSSSPQRFSHASSPTEGKRTMRQTFHFNRALAASIAALMIGAPAAFMLSRAYAPGGGNISNLPAGRVAPPAEIAAAPHMEAAPAVAPAPAPAARDQKAKTAASALVGRLDGVAPPPRVAGSAPNGAERRLSRPALEARSVSAAQPSAPPPADAQFAPEREFRDKFDSKEINPVKVAATDPVSIFSIDDSRLKSLYSSVIAVVTPASFTLMSTL